MRQKTRKKHRKGKRIVLSLLVLILTISAVRFTVNQTAFQDFLHFNTDVASMEHGWNLILVNWEYKIPKDWKVELTELSNGQSVDAEDHAARLQTYVLLEHGKKRNEPQDASIHHGSF